MLDNIKLITYNQTIIQRLENLGGFDRYQHRNHNYDGYHRYGNLMKLDFRKTFAGGLLVGYHHLEISISPHYHYNNYLHNGNDFTPENCIKAIIEILSNLTIQSHEYTELKVVNIEFGLNIVPETDIKKIINSTLYYKKTKFITPEAEHPYFRITDGTKYKQLKTYAKGLQFIESPEYGIDPNTLRYEVKSKKSANISKYGINIITDLLRLETYQRLKQELIDEWENVLIINQTPDFSTLKNNVVQFIRMATNNQFWSDLIIDKNRNKFARCKNRYYQILNNKNNLHHQIKVQIIDKLLCLSSGAYFPQKTTINPTKLCFTETTKKEINGQSAPPHQNNRVCMVTNIDISMQRKDSDYLCLTGLRHLKLNDPETYKKLSSKYLKRKQWSKSEKEHIYYIAHNIRNEYFNKIHNRIKFEQRNYPKNQLQINFVD